MKTTLNIDEDLLREAMEVTKAKSKTAAIEEGLKELIRQNKVLQLAKLGGSLKGLKTPPRRRWP